MADFFRERIELEQAVEAQAQARVDAASAAASAEHTDHARLPAVHTEQGRALKKRLQLREKLAARKRAAGEEEEEEESATAAVADLALDAAKDVQRRVDEASKPADEAPKPKVKLAGKMLVSTAGGQELSKRENARLQALVGSGKAGKMKAFHGVDGGEVTLTEADVASDEVVCFSKCKNCQFVLSSHVTKVFVEDCTDMILRLAGKIVTGVVEVDKCQRCNVLVETRVGTLQIEQCKQVNVVYGAKEYLEHLIWAGCFLMQVQVRNGDTGKVDIMRCDFGLSQQFDRTINLERTQWKVFYLHGKLTCDKIIRLANGFPTTKREDDEHERRKAEKLQGLAERCGIRIHRKEDARRVKPNALCPCGSGRKFKKCCRT